MRSLILVASALLAAADCPAGCSGNGDCASNDACVCYSGYKGAACSERLCGFATAFADTPVGDLNHDGVVAPSTVLGSAYSKTQYSRYMQYEAWPTVSGMADPAYDSTGLAAANLQGGGWAAAADEAHFYAECAGKGLCNRLSGHCTCFDGYTGSLCQRTVCPNHCSGFGRCKQVADLASSASHQFAGSSNGVNAYTGVTVPAQYRLWDANKNMACECDSGYTGFDCSQRVCPRGDDPLTVTKSVCGNAACTNEVQGFTISSGGALAPNNGGTYQIQFVDFDLATYFTDPFAVAVGSALTAAQHAANAAAVVYALQSLPMGVTGNVTAASSTDHSGNSNTRLTVTFSTVSGNLPPFVVLPVTGVPVVTQPSQPLYLFDVTAVSGTTALTVLWSLFPGDATGFRPSTQFSGTSGSVAVTASAVKAAVLAAFNTAVQGATAPSAYLYKYGSTGASVTVSVKPGTGSSASGGEFYVLVQLPATGVTAMPPQVSITTTGTGAGTTPYTSSADAYDGNTEAMVCSNRGLCDFTGGLCQCFAGFTGNACQNQNALAM